MKPSIIIADDHPLVLKGLHDFLFEQDYNVLASAKNGKEALSLIRAHRPDLAILDIKMPFFTGLEIAEKCKNAGLTTKIVLITFEKDGTIYNKAKELGVYGYVLKEFALDEIENCIASVLNNHRYFSPELLRYIEIDASKDKLKVLTKTETKVLTLLSENKTAAEIADELFVSSRTVEKHKSNIRQKLGIDSKSASLNLFAQEVSDFLKNT